MKKYRGKLCVLTLFFCLLFGMQSYAGWVELSIRAGEAREAEEQRRKKAEELEEALRSLDAQITTEIKNSSISLKENETTAPKAKDSETNVSDAGSSASEENIIKAVIGGKEETFYVAVTEKSSKNQGKNWFIVACSLNSNGKIQQAICFNLTPNVNVGTEYEFNSFSYYPSYTRSENDQIYYNNYKSAPTYKLTANESDGTHVKGTFSANPKTTRKHGSGSMSITGSFDICLGEQVDSVRELYDALKGGGSSSGSCGAAPGGDVDTSIGRTKADHTCRTCGGTGRCYICGGDSLNRLGSDEGKVHKCITCHGTGKCQVCYGTGQVY